MGRRRLGGLLAALWVAALSLACATSGHFSSLPQSEQGRFRRCWEQLRTNVCGTDEDPFYVQACRSNAQADYADQTGPEPRKQWLLANGCPPSMVRPEQH